MQQSKYRTLLNVMQGGEFITTKIAIDKYHIRSLSSYISRLKKQGNIKIETTYVRDIKRKGNFRAIYGIYHAGSVLSKDDCQRLAYPEQFVYVNNLNAEAKEKIDVVTKESNKESHNLLTSAINNDSGFVMAARENGCALKDKRTGEVYTPIDDSNKENILKASNKENCFVNWLRRLLLQK